MLICETRHIIFKDSLKIKHKLEWANFQCFLLIFLRPSSSIFLSHNNPLFCSKSDFTDLWNPKIYFNSIFQAVVSHTQDLLKRFLLLNAMHYCWPWPWIWMHQPSNRIHLEALKLSLVLSDLIMCESVKSQHHQFNW